jgi:hypothetical protein
MRIVPATTAGHLIGGQTEEKEVLLVSLLRQESTLQRGAKTKRMVCALDTNYLLKVFATATFDA